MSRSLSATAIAELNAATCAEPYLVLLTIEHDDITTLRFVNDGANITSGGDVYTALAFSAKLPADRDGPVSAKITLDNVDRATVVAVRSITTPATVTIELIRHSAPSTIIATWSYLRLLTAEITASQIVLGLTGDAVLDEAYPGTEFTPLDFPAGFDR